MHAQNGKAITFPFEFFNFKYKHCTPIVVTAFPSQLSVLFKMATVHANINKQPINIEIMGYMHKTQRKRESICFHKTKVTHDLFEDNCSFTRMATRKYIRSNVKCKKHFE